MWFEAVVCFFISATVVSAQIATLPLQPKPDKYKYLPGCYLPSQDIVIPPGRSVYAPPQECMKIICEDDVSMMTLMSVPCGKIPSNMKIDESGNRMKNHLNGNPEVDWQMFYSLLQKLRHEIAFGSHKQYPTY